MTTNEPLPCAGRETRGGLGNLKVILGFLSALVFVICALPIRQSYLIYQTHDEWGPFAIAGYLTGRDWSSITQHIPYYSFGYALVLVPLFWLFEDPVAMYRAALMINAVLTACIVPLAYTVARSLCGPLKKRKEKILYCIIFCASIYTCNVPRANLALCETLLIFLVWAIAALFFYISRKESTWAVLLIAMLLSFGYMVHQRFLGILAPGVLVALYLCMRKRMKPRVFIGFIAIVAGMMLFHSWMKGVLQENLWRSGEFLSVNDYAGQFSKIRYFFSRKGFLTAVRACLGQFYYLICATGMMGIYGFLCLGKDTLSRHSPTRSAGTAFLFLASVCTIGISVVFMLYPNRGDHLFYGRYNEILFGPLLLFALTQLLIAERVWKKAEIFSFVLLAVATFCLWLHRDFIQTFYMLYNVVAMAPYIFGGKLHFVLAAFAAIVLGGTVYFAARKKANLWRYISIGLLCAVFIVSGYMAMYETSIKMGWAKIKFRELTDIIEDQEEEKAIYFVGVHGYNAIYFQYLLQDRIIHECEPEDLPKDIPYVLLVERNRMLEIPQTCRTLGAVQEVVLVEALGPRDGSTEILNLQVIMGTQFGKTEDGQMHSNGEEGFLLFGPYVAMTSGTMEWTLSLSLEDSEQSELGYIDIVCGQEGSLIEIEKIPLTEENLLKSDGTVIIGAESEESLAEVECRVFVYEGAKIRVEDVSLIRK